MTSKQRSKQAQQNGAKAAGAKTTEGLAKSATNSLRHGLTSKTIVLQNESREMFELVRSRYFEEFLPKTQSKWTSSTKWSLPCGASAECARSKRRSSTSKWTGNTKR